MVHIGSKAGVKPTFIVSDDEDEGQQNPKTSLCRQESVVVGVNTFGQNPNFPIYSNPNVSPPKPATNTFGFSSVAIQPTTSAVDQGKIPHLKDRSMSNSNYQMPAYGVTNPGMPNVGYSNGTANARDNQQGYLKQRSYGALTDYPPTNPMEMQSNLQGGQPKVIRNPFELLSDTYHGLNRAGAIGNATNTMAANFQQFAKGPQHGSSMQASPTAPFNGYSMNSPQEPQMQNALPPGFTEIFSANQMTSHVHASKTVQISNGYQTPQSYQGSIGFQSPQGFYYQQRLGTDQGYRGQHSTYPPQGGQQLNEGVIRNLFISYSVGGLISTDRMIQAMEQISKMQNRPPLNVFTCHSMITQYDHNRDGSLSFEEFRVMIINNFFV